MVRRLVSLSALAALALACEQRITAPGSCPEFCPNAEIRMVDSLLTGVIEQDTSFQGYIQAHDAITMQVVGGGAATESRALMRFLQFGNVVGITNTATAPVAEVDSFQLDVVVTRHSPDVTGLAVTVYRLPVGIDTLATFASVAPFFHDSLMVGVMAVPDSASNDTVSTVMLASAFPTFADDGRRIALGLAIQGATPAFASFGTDEGVQGAGVRRFVKADSGGVTVPADDFRAVEFDTFVHTDPPPPPVGALEVGGTPSARSFLRLRLPSSIIDSSDIVAAELFLVPVEPTIGAPTDTFNLIANALSADFGPKSPLLISLDSLTAIGTGVGAGSTDTIALDITPILRLWQENPDQVRTLVLRLRTEAATTGLVRFGSTRGLAAPAVRVTYIPPFSLVQR